LTVQRLTLARKSYPGSGDHSPASIHYSSVDASGELLIGRLLAGCRP
jgi:hypothetical protein